MENNKRTHYSNGYIEFYSRFRYKNAFNLLVSGLVALLMGECLCLGGSDKNGTEEHQLYRGTSFSTNVWALMEARNDSNIGEPRWVGGFTGTAWLYAVSEAGLLFVTAGHNVSSASGEVDLSSDHTRLCFLSHPDYPSIQLNGSMVSLFQEFDVAFIQTPLLSDPSISPCPQGRLSVNAETLGVVGYPRSIIENTKILLGVTEDQYSVSFDKGPWIHFGRVVLIPLLSVQSSDVRLNAVRTIIIEGIPEPGLSGSPVITVDTEAVVGMMLGAVPPTDHSDTQMGTLGFAVAVEEIFAAFQKFIGNGE